MTKIMFVCHGNICRSPMAEFVLKDMVNRRGLAEKFLISSSAASREEIGNPVHPGTKRKLLSCGVPVGEHRAVQLVRADYERYDYLLGMDRHNLANMRLILGGDNAHKVFRLLDFSDAPRDIADPWYTGNFDAAYDDIVEGCEALLKQLEFLKTR